MLAMTGSKEITFKLIDEEKLNGFASAKLGAVHKNRKIENQMKCEVVSRMRNNFKKWKDAIHHMKNAKTC